MTWTLRDVWNGGERIPLQCAVYQRSDMASPRIWAKGTAEVSQDGGEHIPRHVLRFETGIGGCAEQIRRELELMVNPDEFVCVWQDGVQMV